MANEELNAKLDQVKDDAKFSQSDYKKDDRKNDLKGYDFKNGPKPSQYDYNEKDYKGWSDLFMAMMTSYDEKWENTQKN